MTSATSKFSLAAAKTAAADKGSEDLKLATGIAGNEYDELLLRIVRNPDLNDIQATAVVQQITNGLPAFFAMVLSGKPLPAIGGGSGAGRSGDEDRDTLEKLRKAEARNTQLEANQATLIEAIKQALGEDVNLVDDAVPGSTKTSLVRAVAKMKADATPTDSVDKANVKTEVKALEDTVKAAEDKKTVFSSEQHLKKVIAAAKALVPKLK